MKSEISCDFISRAPKEREYVFVCGEPFFSPRSIAFESRHETKVGRKSPIMHLCLHAEIKGCIGFKLEMIPPPEQQREDAH